MSDYAKGLLITLTGVLIRSPDVLLIRLAGVPEWTLVEFRLEPIAGGVRLTVTESGFDHVPEPRRSQVMRSNEGGWAEQVQNINRYVAG